VVIVDDEGLFRDLLSRALAQNPRFQVVGTFADGETALQAAPGLALQVAILDIDLRSPLNGIQVGLALRRLLPEVGIVLLSNHSDPQFIAALPQEAIAGWSYLVKTSVSDVTALERAIAGAAAGFVVLDRELVRRMRPRPGGLLGALTPRQRQILGLMAEGFTNGAIADRLGISAKSVENHINQLYQHLDIDRGDATVHARVRSVLLYLRESAYRSAALLPPLEDEG
jgi:DNA-binding NarL/FixJ family response regulator